MTPAQKAALLAILTEVEPVAEGVATVFGGPLAGAAVTAAANIGNSALAPDVPVVVDTGALARSAAAAPVGVAAPQVSADQFAALMAQMAALTLQVKNQQAPLQSSSLGQGVHVDAVPGVGVQPVVADPKTHPVLLAAGRAPMVPTAPKPTDDDLDPQTATLGDIIAAVNALHSKVAALVEACGLGGSAAMAAHT